MYGRVSYKKQFALGIMLLVTLLIVVEVIVNIWLYNFYRCNFEDNEIFKDVNPSIKRKLCLENLGLDFSEQHVARLDGTGAGGGDDGKKFRHDLVYFNNEGFRSPDRFRTRHRVGVRPCPFRIRY